MIRYAIIDDEPIAHRIIDGYASEMQQLEKAGNCYDAFEAIKLLQSKKIDLLFLDINMPKLSGYEFLNTLSNPPKVIVTSAYKKFAIDSYEFNVVDYLLKPFSFERFIKAINKVLNLKQEQINARSSTSNHLFIKADKKQHRVNLDTILFIEASGNYSKLFLEKEMIITLRKISYFEEILPDNFIRVHNSFIVSKNKIDAIEGNRIHLEKHKIPVGQTYKSVLKKIYDS